ncbi:MAG: serine/threonine-protein phosphatase, partial [Phycisphaerales bacterium]|nr:serine/threonine-protein phosphatase [Phycisphaerales bacterium]
MTTASFETTEFRRSFTIETDELLRKRMIWFISVWGGINLLLLGLTIVMAVTNATFASIFSDAWVRAFFIFTSITWFGAYTGALLMVLKRKVSTKTVVYMSMGLILLDGALGVGIRIMDLPGGIELWSFLAAHLIACCLFPWTVRQAIVPVVIIALASLFTHVVIENDGVGISVFWTIALVGMAVPGIFITGIKHSQRVQRATHTFLSKRYGMLRQELAYARQVHEALYPAPKSTGSLRYAYQYEPMQQIGGDYLYTKVSEATDEHGEKLSVVIIDVTGHGIPAALTVNRLHGEIDICFAENPEISPGELLSKLNKYVHLTLAKHSIYATAVCLRVDHDRGIVEYASGGHPPAFIRGVDGSLRDL